MYDYDEDLPCTSPLLGKTLVNSVSATLNIPKSDIISALDSLSLDENIRAEKFTMSDFEAISNAVYEYKNKG